MSWKLGVIWEILLFFWQISKEKRPFVNLIFKEKESFEFSPTFPKKKFASLTRLKLNSRSSSLRRWTFICIPFFPDQECLFNKSQTEKFHLMLQCIILSVPLKAAERMKTIYNLFLDNVFPEMNDENILNALLYQSLSFNKIIYAVSILLPIAKFIE